MDRSRLRKEEFPDDKLFHLHAMHQEQLQSWMDNATHNSSATHNNGMRKPAGLPFLDTEQLGVGDVHGCGQLPAQGPVGGAPLRAVVVIIRKVTPICLTDSEDEVDSDSESD